MRQPKGQCIDSRQFALLHGCTQHVSLPRLIGTLDIGVLSASDGPVRSLGETPLLRLRNVDRIREMDDRIRGGDVN
ncbi:hypothetical protein D9M72_616210 [compost metagenome]